MTVWIIINAFNSLVSLNWYLPLLSNSVNKIFTSARRGVTMETMTSGGPEFKGCPCLQGRRRYSPSFWNVVMNTSMAFAENNSIQAKFLFKSFWTTAEKKRDKILNKKAIYWQWQRVGEFSGPICKEYKLILQLGFNQARSLSAIVCLKKKSHLFDSILT